MRRDRGDLARLTRGMRNCSTTDAARGDGLCAGHAMCWAERAPRRIGMRVARERPRMTSVPLTGTPDPELELEERAEQRLRRLWQTDSALKRWFATVDHKHIGKRYLVTAFFFLLVGGVEALVMRVQLARADQALLSPEAYDQLFTMHGVTMIFWYASPILSGFANYLIPLMLGARDMALPRLNAFTYWTFLLSGLFLYGGTVVGQWPHGGWFAYPPFTTLPYSPGYGMDFYALALVFLTISTTAGAINFLVTIFRHRAPGMTLSRMPLFMYSTGTTSFAVVFSLPALTVACVFLELERRWGFHFFAPTDNGNPLLWQHLFWFFGHPWVYVIFLPATGMISMLLPVFARRPIVGHSYVALATVLTGLVGFSVWVHHMFATGINHGAMSFFAAASLTISIFSTIQVLAWIATLWRGTPVLTTSLLFALGFIANFVIGGLNGVVTALIPFDWQVHDTYFVVAHLHYVLIGANVFPVFAGFYFWLPKMTGRLLDERLGRVSFALMFVGFNLAFFPMHQLGLAGMPRRVRTYAGFQGWETLNMLATLGAFVLALGILVSMVNFWRSIKGGKVAGANPWNADGLEWSIASPPPPYGSVHLPTVRSRNPLWDEHDEESDPENNRLLTAGRFTLSTTAVDAEPLALASMPEDTVTPLLAGLALTGLFTALLLKLLWVAFVAVIMVLAIAAVWLWPATQTKGERVGTNAGEPSPIVTRLDDRRGTHAMWWFIATEAMLFVMLFFAYFYLGPWPTEEPPKLHFALPMLGVLAASSIVLHFGERSFARGAVVAARALLATTILLGLGFLVLQVLEYREHLKSLTPQANSYGSIFYTLTTTHAIHLCVGLSMLVYVSCLPKLGPTDRPPHRAFANASRYWHFVDAVWAVIIVLVYLLPRWPGVGQ
jgi:cytochrome c oxidase subunit I+III